MSMFDPFKKLKLASAFLGVAEDAVRADVNLELSEVFGRLDVRSLGLDVTRVLEQDGVRPLYDSRFLPTPEPLDRLFELGEGTLGHDVARYLRAQNQQRLVGPPAGFDFRDPAAYLALRVRMTHPIIHVLTEYDASPLGELAVQSYYVGQLGNLMSGVMISSALLQITRDMPDKLGEALAILAEAYQRGQTAKPFLGMAWEELWPVQVTQLRELADLVPRTSTTALLDLDALTPAPPRAPTPSRITLSGFGGGTADTIPARSVVPSAPVENRPEPRPHQVSQSSLLASFMALAEQEHRAQSRAEPEPEPEPVHEAEPELVDPSPARHAKPPPPPPRPVVIPTAPTVARPPSSPSNQPGFSVEEADPKIQPALSPDDPDFF